jgi:capsular exopolysaccharide synthesis family protein
MRLFRRMRPVEPLVPAPPDEAKNIPAEREELAVLHDPQGVIAEQFRRLRNSILVLNPDRASRTILVTSAVRGEGKSVSTLNLALSLVETANVRVIVVDGDVRAPSLERYLGLPRRQGITEMLTGQLPLKAAIRQTSIEGLDILAAGERPENVMEVLNLDRIKTVLHSLKREYDYVLIDTPPALNLNDPSMLGSIADGIILVVRLGETPRHLVEQAQTVLENLGGNILGMCLTGAPPASKKYEPY